MARDTSFLKDIVNIMLIGVDHAAERDTEEWARRGGKQSFHADVMIVLAINTKTGAVNMISLPRDTYAQIPGVKGIYKLNASIDCGGGWPSEANGYSTSGFDKVCEAATWMLGGIPVKYYYAVDMNAVKGLVIPSAAWKTSRSRWTDAGCSYKGRTAPRGQPAVLDYLRVRKGIRESGDQPHQPAEEDAARDIRQVKQSGPDQHTGILDAFDGNPIPTPTCRRPRRWRRSLTT